jgi:hypothetical protein
VLKRFAARIVTGPAAFFLAGAIDLTAFAVAAIRAALAKRLGLQQRR